MRWEVDDRPATLYTRAYMAGMWLARDKRAFEGSEYALRTARKRQRSGDRPPTALTRRAARVSTQILAGMTVWSVLPRHANPTEGIDLRVHEVAAMFHVWMTRLIPEGRRTRRELARLVRRAAAGCDPGDG
jgi:hypothetical protein